jgi:hypothetical protein
LKNPEVDWVSIEVREKGSHLFMSDWIGELQFYGHQFKDGEVHHDWFALSNLHSNRDRDARGYLNLAFQLVNSKGDRPFTGDELSSMPFDEWVKSDLSKFLMF